MGKTLGLVVGLMLMSQSAFALGPCPGIDMVPVPFGYGFACVRQPPIPMPADGTRYQSAPAPGDAYKSVARMEPPGPGDARPEGRLRGMRGINRQR